jgi:hypothetical protein
MRIIGCDLHARQQTVAMLDTDSGELVEKTLQHDGEELRKFYSELSRPVLRRSARPRNKRGCTTVGVCAKGIKKELNTLDAADFVRDVDKSLFSTVIRKRA